MKLPILQLSLTGPATQVAGTTASYQVTVTNTGSASAAQVFLNLTMPDGTIQNPTIGSLLPGGTSQSTITYTIPGTQPAGPISVTARLTWIDAVQTAYGSVFATTTTNVTNPVVLPLITLTPPPMRA